jgi:hypothetical protein
VAEIACPAGRRDLRFEFSFVLYTVVLVINSLCHLRRIQEVQ